MPLQMAVETTGHHAADDQRTLARITFGEAHRIDRDPRSVTIGQPALLGSSSQEHWRSVRPAETGWHSEIGFVSDGHFFFGHILLDEIPGKSLETPAHHAYTTILKCLDSLGGLRLLRVWNVVDAINETQAGLERYRSFCVGRSRAFADQSFADQALPAASGVGSQAQGLMISFIAAPDPGRQIENPRQVSAFRYPPKYGPRSPSFSRALTYRLDDDRHLLFISGTASIVGHETMHAGCLERQFEETCQNLDAVMAAADPAGGSLGELQALRVYVRHEEDALAVMNACRQRFGDDLPIMPLKSAICRRDLLVEIEGVASMTRRINNPK